MAQQKLEEHEITNITKEGYLEKQSAFWKTYRKRWIVLQGWMLYSFKEEKKYSNPTETFDLKIYNKVQICDNEITGQFEILSSNDNRIFIAPSENEMKDWVKCIINATNPDNAQKPNFIIKLNDNNDNKNDNDIEQKSKPKSNRINNALMNEIDDVIRNRAKSTKLNGNAARPDSNYWNQLQTRTESKSLYVRKPVIPPSKSDDEKDSVDGNNNKYKHKPSISSQMHASNSSKYSHFNKMNDKNALIENEYDIHYNYDEYTYSIITKKKKYTIENLRNEVVDTIKIDKELLIFSLEDDIVTDFSMDIIRYFKFSNRKSITFDVELVDDGQNDKLKGEDEEKVNEVIEAKDECIVCMDNERNHICTPCGHLCLCQDCIDVINNKCPICRKECTVIQVFK